MGKHRRRANNQTNFAPLIEIFLDYQDSTTVQIGSIWNPALEENLNASEQAGIESALASISAAIGDCLARVMSREVGEQVQVNVHKVQW